MIFIKNINDSLLQADKDRFIEEITRGIYETWKSYVDWSQDKWRSIVLHRLQSSTDGLPFTLVAYEEIEGVKNFLGSLSIERGCAEAQDNDNLWLCGLYVKPEKRHQGIALLLAQQMLQQLNICSVDNVYLYTVVPELDQLYEQCGFIVKHQIEVEGYPAKVREGSVTEILKKLEQRLALKQQSIEERPQRLSF